MIRSIRAGMGLGDSLYLQSVVRHLVLQGERLRVHTKWNDVFIPLRDKIMLAPFSRLNIDIVAHYTTRKAIRGTSQFEDCCINAKIGVGAELRLDWSAIDTDLCQRIRDQANDRDIVLVQLPRTPMDRKDSFGASLLPDCRVIQKIIDKVRDQAMVVQIGAGQPLFSFSGIELDLANQTTVSQMIDVASIADRFLGYCSFMVPLAESFAKPAMFVWSSRGLRDPVPYVRQITPEKIIHRRKSSHFVVDDYPDATIQERVDVFLQ